MKIEEGWARRRLRGEVDSLYICCVYAHIYICVCVCGYVCLFCCLLFLGYKIRFVWHCPCPLVVVVVVVFFICTLNVADVLTDCQ